MAGKPGVPANRINGITEGVIWQQLLRFFFPILLGTFFQMLYNTADAMIVGKHVGKQALAAVGGATGTLINLMIGFFIGLASGASIIISQFYGAKQEGEVKRTVHTAVALSLLAGLLLTTVGLALSPTLLHMMGTPADVLPFAVTYMRIYFCGMVPSLFYNVGAGILRAVGDSKRPLYFLICSCFANIALDMLLVLVLNMGVAGAALATIISQAISASLVFASLHNTPQCYQLSPRDVRLHGDLLRRIVSIGMPAGLQSVMYSVSNVTIQSGINLFGTDVLAAWTAYGKLDGLFWMSISAFGIAITTFVGQNFGAGRYDRMRKSVRDCILMAACTTLIVCALFLTFGESLLRLFTSDEAVLQHGLTIMRLLVPTFITYICIEVLSGAVRGTGDTLIPTVITLCGICVLRVVWVTVFSPQLNLKLVLMCYPITWVVTSMLFVVYYFKGHWFERGLRRAGKTMP